jgi:hypothetical protein
MLQTFWPSALRQRLRSGNPAPMSSRGQQGRVLVLIGIMVLLVTSAFLWPVSGSASAHAGVAHNSAHLSTAQDVFTRQDIFARGSGSVLYHSRSTAPNVWTGWEAEAWNGAGLDSSPSVIANPDPGTGVIYGAYRSGPDIWDFAYDPSLGITGRLNLGHDCHISSTFGSCVSLENFTSAPTIVSTQAGYLDVFASTDGSLAHEWFTPDDGWSDWEYLDAPPIAGDPAAVAEGVNRIDVFLRSAQNNQLYDVKFDGSWHTAQSLGGVLTASPAATALGSGNIRVIARNTNNTVSTLLMTNNTWGAWSNTSQPVPDAVAPAVTSSSSGGLFSTDYDLFQTIDGKIYSQRFANNVFTTSQTAPDSPNFTYHFTGAPAVTIATTSTVIQPSGGPTPPPSVPPPLPTPTPRPPTPTPTPLPHWCTHPPCPVEN